MFNKPNYEKVKAEIPAQVKILAATKSKPPNDIKQAIEAGIKIIGENYVQEAEEKYRELKEFLKENNISFHLIGHLQSNKAKKAVEIFDCIETLDSIELAKKVNETSRQLNKNLNVFIEVNLGEEQKSGISIKDVEYLVDYITSCSNLKLLGLMTIPQVGKEQESYKMMKELKNKFNLNELSMGMSSDYKEAIANGSTLVRLGTILFGERN